MIALCVIAALLAAGVLWLTFRVLRLRRSLEMERQESRRLKKLLTLGSREINAELDHMHRLRHDLRHSLPLIERSAQIPEALSLDLAATLERPIPPGRSWAVTVLARHYERRAEDQGVAADIRLEIDGGVNVNNIREIAAAGADTFVAGSAIFNAPDYQEVIAKMHAELALARP